MKVTILIPLFTAVTVLLGLPVSLEASLDVPDSRFIPFNSLTSPKESLKFISQRKPLFSEGTKSTSVALQSVDPNKPLTNKSLTDKAHNLTVKAIKSGIRGDYEAAIRYYKAALKVRPNDRGIQISLGHVMYLRDKQKGDIKPNPKVAILLDALQHGKGDWKTSIRYLEDALAVENNKDRLMAVRDALNTTKGIYDDIQFGQELMDSLYQDKREIGTRLALQAGFRCLDEHDFGGAVKSFQVALQENPDDQSIRDMISYAEGQQYLQYERLKGWAENQQTINGQLKAKALQREKEAQQALKQSQKALRLSRELNDTEAASISQRAISIARQALDKAHAMLAWAEARLAAAEKARSLGSKGRRGVASRVKGDVRIKTPQGWKPFDANATVNPGDELRTGPDGFAELMFTDGSTLDMDANTTIKVGKPEREKSIYEEIKGRVRAEFNCAVKFGMPCRQVCYRSPTTDVCIRGTELEITAPIDGPTTVTVMDGVLELTDQNSGKKIKVGKGEQVVITTEGAIKGPVPIDLRSIKRWWED